ncbi:MAG: hypothetical protein ACRCX2_21440 [Paraclostridium sp.]
MFVIYTYKIYFYRKKILNDLTSRIKHFFFTNNPGKSNVEIASLCRLNPTIVDTKGSL